MKYPSVMLTLSILGALASALGLSRGTAILTPDQAALARGGICPWYSCDCGSCSDSSCFEAANGNGYSKKVGNGAEYAICTYHETEGEGMEFCWTVTPAPCWTNKFGCTDAACEQGCSWTPQAMDGYCSNAPPDE